MMVSSKPTVKGFVSSYANDGVSPLSCRDSEAGSKQKVQDSTSLDQLEFPKTMYRWRKLRMKYSEEILRMYPYLAEPDSDGEDDIEEGEEDEYVKWDPVQKVHVKRETPLRAMAKQNITTIPTAEANKFHPEDMVTVEILLKMVSEADNFPSQPTEPNLSPARVPTPPTASSPHPPTSLRASPDRECNGSPEEDDQIPISRQVGGLVMISQEEQNNGKNVDILQEYALPDLQQKNEKTQVESILGESWTGFNSPELPKVLNSETSYQPSTGGNFSITKDNMEIIARDVRSTEKVLGEASHDDPMAAVCEDIGSNHSATGSSYVREFAPTTREEEAVGMGNKPPDRPSLWGVSEIDAKLELTHSNDNHKTSMSALDLIGCGYRPLEKPIGITASGYLGFSASISEYIPDYDRDLVGRCLSATKKRSDSALVIKSPPDTSSNMARDLVYQKGEAAGRQHMMEAAVKIAAEIVKQQLSNTYSRNAYSVNTNLMIERGLRRAALGFYEEDHDQNEVATNHMLVVHNDLTHMEVEEKGFHEEDHGDWSNRKTKAFKDHRRVIGHTVNERPLRPKSTGDKRKHHEVFDEFRDSSRKHRRCRSVSGESDSRRRRQDKSHSHSRPSRDSGRRYEKSSSTAPHKDSRRRPHKSCSRSKSREPNRRSDGKSSSRRSYKDSHGRHNDSDSPDRSHKEPRRSQYDEYNSSSTVYKDSRRKRSEKGTRKAHDKAKDSSPNRGRRGGRDCEYQVPTKVTGNLIDPPNKHHTPSPLRPQPTLVRMTPQKEIRKKSILETSKEILKLSIFATPKVNNKQGRLHDLNKFRRPLQEHHQSTFTSELDRGAKPKKLSPRVEANVLKERPVTPKVSPDPLQKKGSGKDEASHADLHPTSNIGRGGIDNETLGDGACQTSRIGLGSVKNLLTSAEASKVEVRQHSQDRQNTAKVAEEEIPQTEAHRFSKIVSLVKETSSHEESPRANVHPVSQGELSMMRKESEQSFAHPPSGPRSFGSNYPQSGNSREQQPQNLCSTQEYQFQGHHHKGHYTQSNHPQGYRTQGYSSQGYHLQGRPHQGYRSRGRPFRGHSQDIGYRGGKPARGEKQQFVDHSL